MKRAAILMALVLLGSASLLQGCLALGVAKGVGDVATGVVKGAADVGAAIIP